MTLAEATTWMVENLGGVLFGFVALVGTIIWGPKGWNTILERLKSQDSSAGNGVPKLPAVQQAPPVPQNVCLILGQGGTGKTTLISRITDDNAARPEFETILFRLYEHRVTLNQRECKIIFSDYRGQDLGVLTSGILEIEASTEVRRKDLCSLLIILDICDTESGLPRTPETPLPDYEHIQRQVEQWRGQALNAVLGLLTGNRLRFALVLVNKIDLLTTNEATEHLPQIESLLCPLRDKLRGAMPHIPIEVMFGSATGASAIDIRNKLAYHAAAQEA